MNIYDIMRSNSEALASDSQLVAKAATWYGDDFKVFIDQDGNNPPGSSDAPGVQFYGWFKNAAEDRRSVICGYYLLITVSDSTDVTRTEENAFEFAGTERLDWIVERALTVIRANKPANYVMSYEFEHDPITQFPAMLADVRVEFKHELVYGEDPFD